jgi:hypothetical protein
MTSKKVTERSMRITSRTSTALMMRLFQWVQPELPEAGRRMPTVAVVVAAVEVAARAVAVAVAGARAAVAK